MLFICITIFLLLWISAAVHRTARDDTHSSLSTLDSDWAVAVGLLLMMGRWELSAEAEAVAAVVMAVACLEEELRVGEVVVQRVVVLLLVVVAVRVFSALYSVLGLVFQQSSSVGHSIPLILPTTSVLLPRSMLLGHLH